MAQMHKVWKRTGEKNWSPISGPVTLDEAMRLRVAAVRSSAGDETAQGFYIVNDGTHPSTLGAV